MTIAPYSRRYSVPTTEEVPYLSSIHIEARQTSSIGEKQGSSTGFINNLMHTRRRYSDGSVRNPPYGIFGFVEGLSGVPFSCIGIEMQRSAAETPGLHAAAVSPHLQVR